MRSYEAVLILKPDAEEKVLADFRTRINKLLKDGKATNVETIEDNVRDLAHAIGKHPRAHFWRLVFEADPGLIVKVREEIRHDELLLRQTYLHAVSDSRPSEEEESEAPVDAEISDASVSSKKDIKEDEVKDEVVEEAVDESEEEEKDKPEESEMEKEEAVEEEEIKDEEETS